MQHLSQSDASDFVGSQVQLKRAVLERWVVGTGISAPPPDKEGVLAINEPKNKASEFIQSIEFLSLSLR